MIDSYICTYGAFVVLEDDLIGLYDDMLSELDTILERDKKQEANLSLG